MLWSIFVDSREPDLLRVHGRLQVFHDTRIILILCSDYR